MSSIDKLGRVVIPQAIRTRMNLQPGTDVDVTLKGGSIHVAVVNDTGKCACCGQPTKAKAKPARKATAKRPTVKAKPTPKRRATAKR